MFLMVSRLLKYSPSYAHRSSIEILPGEYIEPAEGSETNNTAPFLFIENHLGVPSEVLHRCYVAALAIFANAKKDAFRSPGRNVGDLAASAGVILLANPAHMTALNARKRLIQRQLLGLNKELQFTAALLSSHNGANQSSLWHHRQWLLRRIYNRESLLPDMLCGIPLGTITMSQQTIKNELLIISQACEIYPRNYFAWAHRHFCMQSVILSVKLGISGFAPIISDEIFTMRRWIEQHISDSSAVHHLVTLVESIRRARLTEMFPHGRYLADDNAIHGDAKNTALMSHAISLVQSYPDHESLWLYLRATTPQEVNSQELDDFSTSFIYPWANQTLSSPSRNQKLLTMHAYRFLVWWIHPGYVSHGVTCAVTTLTIYFHLDGPC
jgi:protein prenyltransferase alpha subunit repeat containing protein 1